jgi:hypothetical protein
LNNKENAFLTDIRTNLPQALTGSIGWETLLRAAHQFHHPRIPSFLGTSIQEYQKCTVKISVK